MKKEVEKLLEFWDSSLGNYEAGTINERWINEELFINPINKYVKDDARLLDYGCGTGWLSYELMLMKPNLNIIGIDPSEKVISLNKKCAELSSFNNLKFVCGMEDKLNDYLNYFDVAISVNTLDVLPLDITKNILSNIKKSLKKDAIFIVCINPNYPHELYSKMGYVFKGDYVYKNDILRGFIKTKDEWISIFSEYFSFIEYNDFILVEQEKDYPRRMFVLKNNK